jgi:hypothetical protein
MLLLLPPLLLSLSCYYPVLLLVEMQDCWSHQLCLSQSWVWWV